MVLVVKKLPANAGDKREAGSIPGSGRSPGGGNGNPLQYSHLENSMDRQVRGVTKNWTPLSNWACMSKEYQSLIASEGYLWFVSKPLQMLASTNRSTVSDTPGPPMGAGGRAQKFPTRQRLVAPQTIQTALIGHRWAPERWQVQFQPPTVKQVTWPYVVFSASKSYIYAILEKVSFHSNPKERQSQRMLKLPHNCTHLTH